MAKEGRITCPTMETYKHLYEMNAGYEQVIASLAELRRDRALDRATLRDLTDLAREARACSNACIAETLQELELAEAGRRFKRRITRERREERGE
jgi:hypothetical protein